MATDRHDQNTDEEGYPREVEGEPDQPPFDHNEVMATGWAKIQSWRS